MKTYAIEINFESVSDLLSASPELHIAVAGLIGACKRHCPEVLEQWDMVRKMKTTLRVKGATSECP